MCSIISSYRSFCLAVYQYVSSHLSPPSLPLLFSFLLPIPLLPLPSPHLWDHHHYHHSPKELYSVADIFPASRDKNKVCCFVWSHARAFVPVKKLLSRQERPVFCHCQSIHASLKQKGRGRGGWAVKWLWIRNKEHIGEENA